MQFCAEKLKFDADDQPDLNGISIRYNFDTFHQAFLSLFILLTGENWNEMMYNAMRATSNFTSLYFIIVIILGNFIIVQLLVTIVITNFDESCKFTQKRKIINKIETNIKLGESMMQSIAIVFGNDFEIDHFNDVVKSISIRMPRNKDLKTFKKMTTYKSERKFISIVSKDINNYYNIGTDNNKYTDCRPKFTVFKEEVKQKINEDKE